MKSLILPIYLGLLFVSILLPGVATAQLNKLKKAVDAVIISSKSIDNPSPTEMAMGLKEALEKGTNLSVDRLNLENGFLGNPAIKLPFPEEALQVERSLRKIGLGNLCDQLINSINRAAEDAVKEARPLFTQAIKEMTFKDVQGILLGTERAATDYLQLSTSAGLKVKFAPPIQASLQKVGATAHWETVMSRYNKIPLVKPVDTDLTAYVTDKALQGLFMEIAKEELALRKNSTLRSSPLLQKVFAFADAQKK
ncbi:MAG: DUF4197 domain-containing protein [Algoriphagus sp.]|jgi:hypothetical protein|uniref:DUF4197 domain-containing protein n=1 Tax=Algoriphagus sp. TaxID=1872435 RepID=UPI00274598A0|nr:DUF4197 domain-containing protein [Algoriphagus sp.]MDP4839470.1 DUF4197 domain-containing protein [Algoriphagus sp.]MDP4957366.1 DUF4197 domain-containing protein [Algoriphagus sp.]MDP5125838.1 DUF4197 domain-containing protein [Algoriphagus sp.]